MLCAIHQPNFFPWLGFFDKIAKSDVFVFLNQVDYEKSGHSMQSYTNRVAILDKNNNMKYIHCPVVREHGPQRIDTVKIKTDIPWKKDVISTLRECYFDAPFRDEVWDMLVPIFEYDTIYLSEFNINAITSICKRLNISTRLVRHDELNINNYSSTELLVEIVNRVGCDRYLFGKGGSKYQEEQYFEQKRIVAVPQNFELWEYKQRNEDSFVGGLSILDALFFMGIDATSEKLNRK